MTPFQKPKNSSIAVDQTVTLLDFNDLRDTFCQAAVPVSAAIVNNDIPIGKFLPNNIEIRNIIKNIIHSVKRLIQPPPKMTIKKDASKAGWNPFANGKKIGGGWSSMKKTQHIHILEQKVI